MHRTLLATGAAVLALTAFPAAAQVVGDIGGQVTGQGGGQVATPPLGSTIDRTEDLTGDTVRDTAGRAQSLAVRTADGAVRTVPAAGASVEGGAVVTTMTEAEFEALPQ